MYNRIGLNQFKHWPEHGGGGVWWRMGVWSLDTVTLTDLCCDQLVPVPACGGWHCQGLFLNIQLF